MSAKRDLQGIIPAVPTPFTEDGQPHLPSLRQHIRTLGEEGCDGIVLMGTTGEGPSLGLVERQALIEHAMEVAEGMTVIIGTGCASLADTIALTRSAYELGADATLVIPPFYYKDVPDQGLLAYYRRLLDAAVPENGLLLLYHIPQLTKVPISFELLEGLLRVAPKRVAGIKDSSGDPDHLRELCHRFPQLRVFPGNDRWTLAGLQQGAAGTITAPANVLAHLCVAVFRAFKRQEEAEGLQERLTAARAVLEHYVPFPSSIKYLLSRRYGTPGWEVRPPLVPLSETSQNALEHDLARNGIADWVPWLDEPARRPGILGERPSQLRDAKGKT